MSERPSDESELSAEDVHQVLSNERRQIALAYLREAGGRSTPRELADQIAAVETGEDPPPDNVRQSAYVTLHQTHLPKLRDLGIVEYDPDSKTVALTERAGQVSVYIETVPRYGISWSEYYLALSAIGLLLVMSGFVGVPVLSVVPATTWAAAVFVLVAVSATYQTVQQGSSIVGRLRDDSN